MNNQIQGYRLYYYKTKSFKNLCVNCKPKHIHQCHRNIIVIKSNEYQNCFICDLCEKTFQGVLLDPNRIEKST